MGSRPPRRERRWNPAPSGAGFLVPSTAPLAVALLLLALASPAPGLAAELTGAAEVGAGAVRFEYVERDRVGGFLDGEEGWVPAVELRGGLSAGRLFAFATGRLAAGDVAYDGRTQSTNPANDDLPITTTTRATFLGAELEGGGWLDPCRRVGLYAGLAARHWRRAIQPTSVVSRSGATIPVSGLEEVYGWFELQAGLRAAVVRSGRFGLELDGRLFQILWPRMAVDWGGEQVELALGMEPGWRIAAAFEIEVDPRWSVTLEGAAERFRFGESPIDPVTHIREPASRTTNLAIVARAGRRF